MSWDIGMDQSGWLQVFYLRIAWCGENGVKRMAVKLSTIFKNGIKAYFPHIILIQKFQFALVVISNRKELLTFTQLRDNNDYRKRVLPDG